MDIEARKNRVKGLEAIKSKALDMATQGLDSLEVRDFVSNASKELAYRNPDEDSFKKAARASDIFKKSK